MWIDWCVKVTTGPHANRFPVGLYMKWAWLTMTVAVELLHYIKRLSNGFDMECKADFCKLWCSTLTSTICRCAVTQTNTKQLSEIPYAYALHERQLQQTRTTRINGRSILTFASRSQDLCMSVYPHKTRLYTHPTYIHAWHMFLLFVSEQHYLRPIWTHNCVGW